MPREYSNKELERMVTGPIENPNVIFYEKSRMNPDLSKEAGKRIYQTRLMIKKTQPGLADFAAYTAQPADIEEWPDEYEYFTRTRDDVGSPPVDIIPGINPDEIQELIDYGIITITKLCEAQTLPAHLQHVQASARRINEVLEHEQEVNEKTPDEAKSVPETDRREYPADVGGPGLQASAEDGSRDTIQRACKDRRDNGSEGNVGATDGEHQAGREVAKITVPKNTVPGCNWDISFG